MDKTHEIALVEETPSRRSRPESEVLALAHGIGTIGVPVGVRAQERQLVERRRKNIRNVEVGGDADS